MKIAYLVNQYPAISHTFIRREIAALEAQGLEVARYSIRPVQHLVDEADRSERQRTHCLLGSGPVRLALATLGEALSHPIRFARALAQAVRLGCRSERGIGVHLVYLAEAGALRRRLAAGGVRHLHAHFGTNPAAVALLCHTLGGPSYSFTAHGTETTDAARVLALDQKIREAAFVLAVCDYGRSQLWRWADPADWARIHVVRCGVDESFLQGSIPPLPEARRLVCVGRLSGEKGQLLLVQAAGLLRDRGLDFELVLVGDGPLRAEIEALIARLDLGGHVRLVGAQDGDGVRRAMLAARALVHPSFAEGLPVVIMEALALGRPVISTYVAGIPELVRPGETGWLVPAGSVEPLAQAMATTLSADPVQLRAMGRTGAALVRQHHHAAVEAARLAALIRQAHGSGPAATPTSAATTSGDAMSAPDGLQQTHETASSVPRAIGERGR